MSKSRLYLSILIALLIGAFFYFDLQQLLTLDKLKSQQETIVSYRNDHPLLATAIYALVYIAVTGLSLPGAYDLDACWRRGIRFIMGNADCFFCLQHRRYAGISGSTFSIPRCR